MRTRNATFLGIATIIAAAAAISACSGDPYPSQATGGAPTTSGGATSTGGVPSTGGGGGVAPSSGGASTGGASTGGAAAATFAQVKSILDMRCAVVGCHAGSQAPDLRSTNAALYTTLTSTMVMECSNNVMVKPGDPTTSSLISVLTGKCTNFSMPLGCTTNMCIPAAEIATITSWIQAGAPQ